MITSQQLSRIVEQEVANLPLPEEPSLLYAPIRYTLEAGGKRIRPLLTLGCYALFRDDLSGALPAAMGIEVFHNFTLLHDDIMDNSSLRRGRETVHVKWNNNTAILSGDAMLIYAYELAAGSDREKLPQVMPVLNRIFLGVCEGQQYDIDFENRTDVTAEEYLDMIGLKTAVLIAGAMKIGAILGGADPTVAEQLYEAGMLLGKAFQLQDDLLDTYGDHTVWGKNTGDDIADNKKTYLLIKAFELSGEEDKKQLREWTASTDFDRETKIEAVKAIYAKTDVRNVTEELVGDYFARANLLIDSVPVENARKQALRELAKTLVGRKK